jgi:DNA polymerase III delta subunit
MKSDQFKKSLKKGKVANQYLMIADEPLLIDNAVKLIKKTLDINGPFDGDTFFASETPVEEIFQKLYLAPFSSAKRLLVVKNLEELNNKALVSFAEVINHATSQNCLVMTYVVDKDARRSARTQKKIEGLFTQTKPVYFSTDASLIHKWIASKIKRDNLKLTPSLVHYLEEEFNNDITGLKNEFDKIENYLHETGAMSTADIKDLAKGVCNFNKYHIANAFTKGRKDILELFEELRPYLRSYAEIVDALTRSFVFYVQRNKTAKPSMVKLTDEVTQIDQQVKKSSNFVYLMLELFFLRNVNFFRKGAVYGG